MNLLIRLLLLPWFIKESVIYTKGTNKTLKQWLIACYKWIKGKK